MAAGPSRKVPRAKNFVNSSDETFQWTFVNWADVAFFGAHKLPRAVTSAIQWPIHVA